ncbi:hypothetical protein SAURM35S_00112 [Streptomyces aurantiogriseus]
MSTALCRAYTPGAGSGGTFVPSRTRCSASSRWVLARSVRSRWVSTMAPTAAVMSRAPVISKAKTYLVKIRAARPSTLPPALASARPLNSVREALPIPATRRMPKPRPQTRASQRWPLMVSFRESAAVTPTSITTNRNSIMIAPV